MSIKIGVDPDTPYGKGSVARAYASERISLISDVLKDSALSAWHDYYERFNINSVCSIPIPKSDKIEYIYLLMDSMQNAFSENNIDRIIEMANSCAEEIAGIIKTAINSGEISSSDIWDRNYIPIPDTNPQKYRTI